jgi:hypothetical protein
VIEVVDRVGVPLLSRVIIELGKTLYGYSIPAFRLIGLLELGESTAYRTNSAKYSVWLCPALTNRGFLPMQQLATVSSWPLETRIIGSRSLRVIHLKTLLFLLGLAGNPGGPSGMGISEGLTQLLRRYAESVPGAMTHGGDLDSMRIRVACLEELVHIETSDLEERTEAASRLKALEEEIRFWGRLPMKWTGIGTGGDK